MADPLESKLSDNNGSLRLTGPEAVRLRDASVSPMLQSVPGEYLAMLLVAHAGFVALAWGCCSPDWLSRIGMPVAAVWAIARLVGMLSSRLVTPAISLAMIVLTIEAGSVAPQESLEWLVDGPFSAVTLLVTLGLVFLLDLLETAGARGGQLADVVKRDGIGILVTDRRRPRLASRARHPCFSGPLAAWLGSHRTRTGRSQWPIASVFNRQRDEEAGVTDCRAGSSLSVAAGCRVVQLVEMDFDPVTLFAQLDGSSLEIDAAEEP